MCRVGGRRCPGCAGSAARQAHNRRRRENRQLRARIADLAQQQGESTATVDQMRAGPPEQAKRWARENGLPSELHPGRGHTSTPVPPPRPLVQSTPWANEFWMEPTLSDRIQAVLDDQGRDAREERLLRPTSVRNIIAIGVGTNAVYETEFDDGVVGFHKPFESLDDSVAAGYGHGSMALQPVLEFAAWKLARDLGPPWSDHMPATVLREVQSRFGVMTARQSGQPPAWPDLGLANATNVADMGFFDALIGQQDRHPGNYLVEGITLQPIDHGYTFARDGDYMNYSFFFQYRYQHEPELRDYELQALQRLLASKDSFGLGPVIGQERHTALVARAAHMLNVNGFKIGF